MARTPPDHLQSRWSRRAPRCPSRRVARRTMCSVPLREAGRGPYPDVRGARASGRRRPRRHNGRPAGALLPGISSGWLHSSSLVPRCRHRVRNSPADGRSPPFPLNNETAGHPHSIGECPTIADHRSTISGAQAESSVVRSCPGSHGQYGDRALEPRVGGRHRSREGRDVAPDGVSPGNVPASSPRGRGQPGRWLNRDLAVGTAGQGPFRLPR
jgi:hypothetical protein